MGDCWVEVWWEECGEERCEVLDVKCFLSAEIKMKGRNIHLQVVYPMYEKRDFQIVGGYVAVGYRLSMYPVFPVTP